MKQTVISVSFRIALAALLMPLVVTSAIAQQAASPEKSAIVLKAYGPGGPAPAMREAAKVFGAKKGNPVEITAGPTPTWKDQAMKDADLIFSGSEYMLTDFVRKDVPGLMTHQQSEPFICDLRPFSCARVILRESKALKTLPNRALRSLWLKEQDRSECGRM
jgi:accessory colonization factor AcfC